VKSLVTLGDDRVDPLPAPDTLQLSGSTAVDVRTGTKTSGIPADAKTVERITLAEEMNDQLKY
jgi:hypothetical protein